MKLKNDKKGQIFPRITEMVVALAAVGLAVTIGLLVLIEGQDQIVEVTATNQTINESKAITADVFTDFGECVNNEAMVVNELWNSTGSSVAEGAPTLLLAANYSVSLNTVNISDDNLGAMGSFGASINITYTCVRPDGSYNGTVDMQNATSDIPGWMPIVVVVIIGGLMIALMSRFRR